jgi:hypothetical protein
MYNTHVQNTHKTNNVQHTCTKYTQNNVQHMYKIHTKQCTTHMYKIYTKQTMYNTQVQNKLIKTIGGHNECLE